MNAAGRHHFSVPNAEYRDWRQWRYDHRIIVVLKTPCAPSDSWRLSPEATSSMSTDRTWLITEAIGPLASNASKACMFAVVPEHSYVSTALHKQVYHGRYRDLDLPAKENVLQDVPG